LWRSRIQVLPADGETEGVELVVLDEVVHLGLTGGSRVDEAAGGGTVGVHAEIEASNVDTGVLILVLVLNAMSLIQNTLTLTLPLAEEAAEVTTAWLVVTGALEGAAVVALAEVAALVVAGEPEPAPGMH
jgi:hypothetical protein